VSKAAFQTGIVGGMAGVVASGIGIIWGFMSMSSHPMNQFMYAMNIVFNSFSTDVYFFPVQEPANYGLLILLSVALAVSLIVACVLTGVGFYGFYSTRGGSRGVVSLLSIATGSALGALLIVFGTVSLRAEYYFMPWNVIPLLITLSQEYTIIGMGMIILAATFILLGVTSIVLRENTTMPSDSMGAGILSIIGACLLIPHILGSPLTFIGFAVVLVAFVLWARVFYSFSQWI